jgi:hypothetical protein
MSKSNVNPGQYKVAGRERQGEDIAQIQNKQKLAESLVRSRFEGDERFQQPAPVEEPEAAGPAPAQAATPAAPTPATKKQTTKKSAAKRATKKPATKKRAAKKPAARKPAAKKRATSKRVTKKTPRAARRRSPR